MASCPASYSWANNQAGHSPCYVASVLRGVCDFKERSLQAIGPGGQYSAPSGGDQNSCTCSTVVYELMSACADCQGGSFSSWSEYSRQCAPKSISIGFYPHGIPTGAETPLWTYADVRTHPTFDPVLAGEPQQPQPQPQPQPQSQPQTSANPTQSADPTTTATTPGGTSDASPPSTDTSEGSTPSATSSAASNSDSSQDSPATTAIDVIPGATGSATATAIGSKASAVGASYGADGLPIGTSAPNADASTPTAASSLSNGKKSNAGAIAGGVIGALLLLLILGGLLYRWMARRRRRRVAPSAAYMATYGTTRPDTSQTYLARERSITPGFEPLPEISHAAYMDGGMRENGYDDSLYLQAKRESKRESSYSTDPSRPHQFKGVAM